MSRGKFTHSNVSKGEAAYCIAYHGMAQGIPTAIDLEQNQPPLVVTCVSPLSTHHPLHVKLKMWCLFQISQPAWFWHQWVRQPKLKYTYPSKDWLRLHLTTSSIFDHNSRQSLRVLHVHCLHVAIKLLFRTFLIVSLSRYSHAQSVWYTFDTCLPHFLVELRIKADVFGSLALGKHVSMGG